MYSNIMNPDAKKAMHHNEEPHPSKLQSLNVHTKTESAEGMQEFKPGESHENRNNHWKRRAEKRARKGKPKRQKYEGKKIQSH